MSGWVAAPYHGWKDAGAVSILDDEWDPALNRFIPEEPTYSHYSLLNNTVRASLITSKGNNPELAIHIDVPDNVAAFPGAPAIVQVHMYLSSPGEPIQTPDNVGFTFEIDLGGILTNVIQIADASAVSSSYAHIYNVWFKGAVRALRKMPTLVVKVTPLLPQLGPSNGAEFSLLVWLQWAVNTVLPVHAIDDSALYNLHLSDFLDRERARDYADLARSESWESLALPS